MTTEWTNAELVLLTHAQEKLESENDWNAVAKLVQQHAPKSSKKDPSWFSSQRCASAYSELLSQVPKRKRSAVALRGSIAEPLLSPKSKEKSAQKRSKEHIQTDNPSRTLSRKMTELRMRELEADIEKQDERLRQLHQQLDEVKELHKHSTASETKQILVATPPTEKAQKGMEEMDSPCPTKAPSEVQQGTNKHSSSSLTEVSSNAQISTSTGRTDEKSDTLAGGDGVANVDPGSDRGAPTTMGTNLLSSDFSGLSESNSYSPGQPLSASTSDLSTTEGNTMEDKENKQMPLNPSPHEETSKPEKREGEDEKKEETHRNVNTKMDGATLVTDKSEKGEEPMEREEARSDRDTRNGEFESKERGVEDEGKQIMLTEKGESTEAGVCSPAEISAQLPPQQNRAALSSSTSVTRPVLGAAIDLSSTIGSASSSSGHVSTQSATNESSGTSADDGKICTAGRPSDTSSASYSSFSNESTPGEAIMDLQGYGGNSLSADSLSPNEPILANPDIIEPSSPPHSTPEEVSRPSLSPPRRQFPLVEHDVGNDGDTETHESLELRRRVSPDAAGPFVAGQDLAGGERADSAQSPGSSKTRSSNGSGESAINVNDEEKAQPTAVRAFSSEMNESLPRGSRKRRRAQLDESETDTGTDRTDTEGQSDKLHEEELEEAAGSDDVQTRPTDPTASKTEAETTRKRRNKGKLATSPSSEAARRKAVQHALMSSLKTIDRHRYAPVFRHPVTEDEAPGYFDVVSDPICLKDIQKKVKDGEITSSTELNVSLRKLLDNAYAYNDDGTDVHEMTNEIADCIAKEMKSLVQSEHALLTAQPTTRRKGQMVAEMKLKNQEDEKPKDQEDDVVFPPAPKTYGKKRKLADALGPAPKGMDTSTNGAKKGRPAAGNKSGERRASRRLARKS